MLNNAWNEIYYSLYFLDIVKFRVTEVALNNIWDLSDLQNFSGNLYLSRIGCIHFMQILSVYVCI